MDPAIPTYETKISRDILQTTPPWTTLQKITFRFLFLLLLLFIIIQNNGAFPFLDIVMAYPEDALHVIIPWIGKNILHLSYDITIFTNGSGDTTYDYLLVFTIFCISVIGTIIWSVLDRNRPDYATLYYWLTVAVRFYVGLMLISYGLIKVFKLQFPYPGISRLTQPYGLSTPMGLAWTFLGFSKGYNLFMGFAEIAAILLLFRRTVTLGTLITLATTANVMAVNYFYDVPVKILSTALFLMTFFLMAHDGRKLIRFFLENKAVALEPLRAPVVNRRWLRVTMLSFKLLVIGYVLLYGGFECYQRLEQYGPQAPKPPFYGFYETRGFMTPKDTTSAQPADVRWKHLLIEWKGYATVRYMNDTTKGFFTKVDTTQQTMNFTMRRDTTQKYHFRYEVPDSDHFILKGKIAQDSTVISFFRHTEIQKIFKLTNRGFHWVNEYPNNR